LVPTLDHRSDHSRSFSKKKTTEVSLSLYD
jgi:hypothetical protein